MWNDKLAGKTEIPGFSQKEFLEKCLEKCPNVREILKFFWIFWEMFKKKYKSFLSIKFLIETSKKIWEEFPGQLPKKSQSNIRCSLKKSRQNLPKCLFNLTVLLLKNIRIILYQQLSRKKHRFVHCYCSFDVRGSTKSISQHLKVLISNILRIISTQKHAVYPEISRSNHRPQFYSWYCCLINSIALRNSIYASLLRIRYSLGWELITPPLTPQY